TAFINSGGGDTTPPTAAVTAPVDGAQVSGSVTIQASATDNVGVTRVVFYLDGALLGSDTSAPYSFTWSTSDSENGAHTLMVRALDAAGNLGSSATVAVTVNNPGRASYDPTLMVPRCAAASSYCDSTTLLNGRANLGP